MLPLKMDGNYYVQEWDIKKLELIPSLRKNKNKLKRQKIYYCSQAYAPEFDGETKTATKCKLSSKGSNF